MIQTNFTFYLFIQLKKMKKLFFAVAILMVSTFSFAQGFGGGQGMNFNPEDMAKRQVDRLNEQVQLTKAQQDTLTTFFLAQSKAQQARREKMQQDGGGQQMGQGFSEEMMKEMQAQREAQTAKIKSVLTPEQFQKYQKAEEERRQQMGQGGGFGGGMGGFGGGAPQGG